MYCAVVLDVYARRVVGWSIDASPTAALVTHALGMAIDSRRPPSGSIIHSDQGVQGEFNRSSQHLDEEVRRWEERVVGLWWRRVGRRCGHRGGRRWRAGRIGRSSGWRSLVVSPVTKPASRPACRQRWAAAGSRAWRHAADVDHGPASGRYLSFAERDEIAICRATASAFVRSPAISAARRPRSRGRYIATPPPAVGC